MSGQFRSGLWLKDSVRATGGDIERLRFVNIGELLPDGTLRDVRVFEFDAEMRLTEIVSASAADYAPPDAWRLSGVSATRFIEVAGPADAPLLRAEQLAPGERLGKDDRTTGVPGVLTGPSIIPR